MQNCSVLVQARPAAPAVISTKATASAPNITPRPSVTREHVWQRCLRLDHQPMSFSPWSAAQDVLDQILDFGVVLGLRRLVALFLAVDLDRRIGGEMLVERGFGVGLALVFLGGRLEGGPVFLGA